MIKRKTKICIECGNDTYIFSRGKCKRCASKSYGKLKPVSEKGRVKRENKRKTIDLDFQLYLSIWLQREHICYECVKPIYGEINICYFHHILKKSRFPEYRHDPENIVILCKDCHNQVETNLSKSPKVKALTIKLLKEKEKDGFRRRILEETSGNGSEDASESAGESNNSSEIDYIS